MRALRRWVRKQGRLVRAVFQASTGGVVLTFLTIGLGVEIDEAQAGAFMGAWICFASWAQMALEDAGWIRPMLREPLGQ